MRLALWLYRLALKTLPPAVTQKHEQAMLDLFAAELARARSEGHLSWMAAFVTGTWDALARGLYERFRRAEPKRGGGVIDACWRDLRHAARLLRRSPRF